MSLVPFVHIDASLEAAPAGALVALSSDEVHHLSTVLRLEQGAEVEVADGAGGSASAQLEGRAVRLRTAASWRPADEPRIVVAQALPKGRKLDEVVRQATELGAAEIVPVAAERCVVRLVGPKADRAVARWSAVARAASEQARRPYRPQVASITPMAELVQAVAEPGTLVLVAHPGQPGLPQQLEAAREAGRVVIAVGPEGGFTDAEVAMMATAGARLVGLGPTTLRTEHAAPAAVAVLAAGLGRWD